MVFVRTLRGSVTRITLFHKPLDFWQRNRLLGTKYDGSVLPD